MALIGEIRKRSGLLVGVIAASIIGFLIMDATNSQSSVLRGGRSNDVGVVGGEDISYNEYQKIVDDAVRNMEDRMRGQQIPDDQKNYIRQQAWDNMVNEKLLTNATAALGLTVSDDEMVELFTGKNPHQFVAQQFTSPQTGQFDPQFVKQFMQGLDQDERGQEPGSKRRMWTNFEKEVKKAQLTQKYNNLITKGMTTPTWMAEMAYNDQNKTADIRYLMLPYSDINDTEVKLSDDDLRKYLNANAARFKQQEETRKLQYVAFDIYPSSVDSAAALSSLTVKLEEFANGKTKGDDSIFVKLYSETPMVDLFVTKDQLVGSPIIDSLFSRPVRSVIGPYIEGDMYKFAKISDSKLMSDSVRVRQIVFSFNNVQNEAQQKERFKLIDSVFRAIDSLGADFGQMAAVYSDDNNSKINGGLVGWVKFNDPQHDEFYKSIVFHNGKLGKVYRYVNQQENAVKLLQIVQESPSKMGLKIAYFTKGIIPSPETERTIYAAVSKFAGENSTEDKFKAYAKANPQMVKDVMAVRKADYSLPGIGNARSLVKWAYEAKLGEVSPIKTIDKKHVVAYLEAVRTKGTPTLEGVKEQVKFMASKDKKYELLCKKIADAKSSNIDELASKLGKQVMQADRVVFASPILSSGGYEPAVVATGLVLANGKMSAPVKGNQGVYVVQKIAGIDPPKATDLTNYMQQLKQQAQGKASRGATEVLKQIADVQDNRLQFEAN